MQTNAEVDFCILWHWSAFKMQVKDFAAWK